MRRRNRATLGWITVQSIRGGVFDLSELMTVTLGAHDLLQVVASGSGAIVELSALTTYPAERATFSASSGGPISSTGGLTVASSDPGKRWPGLSTGIAIGDLDGDGQPDRVRASRECAPRGSFDPRSGRDCEPRPDEREIELDCIERLDACGRIPGVRAEQQPA